MREIFGHWDRAEIRHQSINISINQLINQSINQSINQKICQSLFGLIYDVYNVFYSGDLQLV